jgi:thiamine-monophosphate kinase
VIDPDKAVGEVGERALLDHLRARIPAGDGVTLGLGDDAAAVVTGALTLVTTDVLVEGVHFVRAWSPPRLLGRKALSVNLSDIAAMAGVPRYATVSLCLPRDLPAGFVDGLYDGLLERAAQTGVSLVGGNLSAIAGPVVIDVTLLGHGDRLLSRAGARPGDRVVVTGTLGAAAAAVGLMRQGARLADDGELADLGVWTASSAPAVTRCLRAHLDPEPPLAFARSLAEGEWVHAAMDLSDGLSGDLLALCRESGLGARIDGAAIPVDPAAAAVERARGGDAASLALHGGEDYQLLLAVPPGELPALRERALVWNLTLADLGEFVEGETQVLLGTAQGTARLEPVAHDHFRVPPPPAAARVGRDEP